MKVAELIKQLQQLPQDLQVFSASGFEVLDVSVESDGEKDFASINDTSGGIF